jgi:hypothetical protein
VRGHAYWILLAQGKGRAGNEPWVCLSDYKLLEEDSFPWVSVNYSDKFTQCAGPTLF